MRRILKSTTFKRYFLICPLKMFSSGKGKGRATQPTSEGPSSKEGPENLACLEHYPFSAADKRTVIAQVSKNDFRLSQTKISDQKMAMSNYNTPRRFRRRTLRKGRSPSTINLLDRLPQAMCSNGHVRRSMTNRVNRTLWNVSWAYHRPNNDFPKNRLPANIE